MTAIRQPTFFIPHGGGPCFFMEWTMGPRDTWDRMAAWLREWPSTLPAKPTALLVISGHWEEAVATVNAGAHPPLLFDYGARIRIAYVESPASLLFAQNRARDAVVPEAVIRSMLERWEIPGMDEAHVVEHNIR